MLTWPEEPEVTDWEPVDDATLAGRLGALIPTSGAALVLIDGRSGNGKSTLGDRICRLIGAGLIHTDGTVGPLRGLEEPGHGVAVVRSRAAQAADESGRSSRSGAQHPEWRQ